MIHDTNYELFMAMMKPKVTWKAKPVCGRAIWYAHQGPMRVRTGPKLTKAEKKAAKKARTYRKLLPEIFERMRTTIKN